MGFVSRFASSASATCLALCLACVSAPLGASGIRAGDMTWRRIDEAKGYSGGSVAAILQDKRGILWIGATGGLFRYDGAAFTAFRPRSGEGGLASSSVSCIAEDRWGELWIGTLGAGLFRYDRREGVFERFELEAGGMEAGPASRITALAAEASGLLLVGTAEGGLLLVDPSNRRVRRLPDPGSASESVTCVLADSRGRLWAGTEGGGLARYDAAGSLTARYQREAGRAASLGSDFVAALLEDSLGYLWIGLGEGGVDLFEDDGFQHARSYGAGKPGHRITALAEDPRGQIWMGYSEGGLGILDPATMETAMEDFAGGLEIRVLFRDRRGLLWVGLERDGLLTGDIRSASFDRFTRTLEGAELGSIGALAVTSEGRLHVATDEGLFAVFDAVGGGFVSLRPSLPGLDARKARVMRAAPDGSLWIGGALPGLARLSPDGRWRWYPRPRGEAGLVAAVLSLEPDGHGRFFVGTEGDGVELFDPRDGVYSRLAGESRPGAPPGRAVTCLSLDARGRLWAGSAESGLSFLDPATGRWATFPRGGGSIGDLRIQVLHRDSRGTLLVGTGGAGLVAVDTEAGKIVYRGAEAGLEADSVHGVAEDGSGTLWIASSSGLYSLDPARMASYLYGAEDGLCPGSLRSGAIALDAQGRVALGSSQGLTRFEPSRVPRFAPAPEVVIEDVVAAGSPLPFPGPARSLESSGDGPGISLPHDNPGLRFSVAVIDFLAPERNRYAMLLEGRNPSWVTLGSVNAGLIAPIAPGSYMLRVKAANGNGIWNDYGASLRITVSPPWWATLWFRAAAGGGLAGLAAVALFARVGALRKRNALLAGFARHVEEAREQERVSAARDIHDEIGQHLMVLNLHAYWLASHPDAAPDRRSERVTEMQATIQEAMGAVRSVAGRLRPAALDTQDLPDALRLQLRGLRSASGIEPELSIEGDWRRLPRSAAEAVLKLAQEMLGNVARHSGARRVALRLACGETEAELRVTDDGRGIDPARIGAPDSFGIIGMRERCASLGGSLEFAAADGGGCAVTARFPVAG